MWFFSFSSIYYIFDNVIRLQRHPSVRYACVIIGAVGTLTLLKKFSWFISSKVAIKYLHILESNLNCVSFESILKRKCCASKFFENFFFPNAEGSKYVRLFESILCLKMYWWGMLHWWDCCHLQLLQKQKKVPTQESSSSPFSADHEMRGAEQHQHLQKEVLLLVININIIKQLTNIYSYYQEILGFLTSLRCVWLDQNRRRKTKNLCA